MHLSESRTNWIAWIVGSVWFVAMQTPVATQGISYLDEGYLVINAQKILEGKVPYRDFFATTTPGTFYIQAGLIKLFGESLAVERWEYIILEVAILGVGLLAFKLENWQKWLWVGSMAVINFSPQAFGFYNQQVVLLVMVAGFLLRKKYWFRAGIVMGLAFWVKQSVGLIVMAGLIWWVRKNREGLIKFGGGAALVMAVVVGYFGLQGSADELGYYTLKFASEVKSHQADFVRHRAIAIFAIAGLTWAQHKKWLNWKWTIAAVSGVTALYLAAKPARIGRILTYLPDPVFWLYNLLFIGPLWTLLKSSDEQEKLESVMLLGVFLGIAASGYTKGLGFVVAPLLIAWLLKRLKKHRIIVIIIIIGFTLWVSPVPDLASAREENRGMTAKIMGMRVSERESEKVEEVKQWIDELAGSRDKVLCFPHCPMINVLSKRDSGVYFSVFYFELFRKQDQEKEIMELEREKPKVLVLQHNGLIDQHADDEYQRLPILTKYFEEKYKLWKKNEEFEVRTRVN